MYICVDSILSLPNLFLETPFVYNIVEYLHKLHCRIYVDIQHSIYITIDLFFINPLYILSGLNNLHPPILLKDILEPIKYVFPICLSKYLLICASGVVNAPPFFYRPCDMCKELSMVFIIY